MLMTTVLLLSVIGSLSPCRFYMEVECVASSYLKYNTVDYQIILQCSFNNTIINHGSI